MRGYGPAKLILWNVRSQQRIKREMMLGRHPKTQQVWVPQIGQNHPAVSYGPPKWHLKILQDFLKTFLWNSSSLGSRPVAASWRHSLMHQVLQSRRGEVWWKAN